MSGLFHLQGVALLSKHRHTPLEGMLGKSIRECADREQGRDVPLEDFYHACLSFWQIRDDVFLVRFSNVDSAGKPHGNISTLQTLVDVTLCHLRAKTRVYTPVDDPDRYHHFYNPAQFDDYEYLFVPNNKYVRTMVVSYRR